jgi:hypothetical protein
MYLSVCVFNGDIYSIGGYFYFVFSLIAARSFFQVQIYSDDLSLTNA